MTTETVNYWTHGPKTDMRPHEWRYLGREKQAYVCVVCQLRVTKVELKAETDA